MTLVKFINCVLFLLSLNTILLFESLFAQTENPWVGVWNSSYGPMTLVETSGKISGTYIRSNGELGKISNGVVSGNKLTGRWSEPETYLPPWDAGDFEFTITDDKLSFSGKWRWDQGSIWWGWSGTKGFSISGAVVMNDGSAFGNCEVQLLQDSKVFKTTKTAASGGYSFTNIQPGNYVIKPISETYKFTPESIAITFGKESQHGNNFKVALNFFITLKSSSQSIVYEQEIDITAEIKNSNGVYITEQHSIQFREINEQLGSFTPSNGIVTTSNGKATIKYKAPTKNNAGAWSTVKIKAEDKNITSTDNYTILEIPFGLDLEVWTEPRDPYITQNSKTAIIPADDNFPALVFAKSLDKTGKPQINVPIKFSLSSSSPGKLILGNQSGKSITVNTDNEGIAKVYYHYVGSKISSKVIDEVTIVDLNDSRTGSVKIEIGLGLEIYKKERYQSQPGIISSGVGQDLVLYIRSTIQPSLDLKAYNATASIEVWDGKEIGVFITVDWLNKPKPSIWNKIFTQPEDIVYQGRCGIDKLGSSYILWARDNPRDAVGDHILPQIIPKSEGSHLYKISVDFIESVSGGSGYENVSIRYPLLGIEVDRQYSTFENFICAFSPSQTDQLFAVESIKIGLALKVCEHITWIGDIMTAADMICKVMQGDNIGALKTLFNYMGGKYIDARSSELADNHWLVSLTEREFLEVIGAICVKETVDWSQRVDSWIKIKAEQESGKRLNKNNSYQDFVNEIEYQDLVNQFAISFLAGAKLKDYRIVTVYNASQSKVLDSNNKEAPLVNNEYSNIGEMMYYSDGNIYSYLLNASNTYNLEFKSDKNFAVSICDPLKTTYTLYNIPSTQLAKGKLTINNNSNPLQIDYGDNGSIDLTKNPETITPGQTGGTTGSLAFDWTFQAGGTGIDGGWRIKNLDDSNIVFGGHFDKTIQVGTKSINSMGGLDFYLSSLSKMNTVNWAYSGGGSKDDYFSDLTVDKNGDILFTGTIASQATFDGTALYQIGERDAFLIKASKFGKIKWSKVFGGSSDDYGVCLGSDDSFNCYIAGTFQSSQLTIGSTTLANGGMQDIFLVKLSSSGTVLWSKSIKGSSNQYVTSMHVYNDGSFLIVGRFKDDLIIQNSTLISSTNSEDLFIAKFTKDGDLVWVKQYGGSGVEIAQDLKVDGNGNILITGQFTSSFPVGSFSLTNKGWNDAFLIKLNSIGNTVWVKSGGSINDDCSYALTIDKNNSVSIAGNVRASAQFDSKQISCSPNTSYSFFIKYDKDGNIVSTSGPVDPTTSSYDIAYDLEIDNTGSYYMIGTFNSKVKFSSELTCKGMSDVYIVKYKPTYTTDISHELTTQIPVTFSLSQNYPNPFNPSTTISYKIAEPGHVTLRVYDLLGRVVATLVDEYKAKGMYNSVFQIEDDEVPSGIYFYRLQSANYSLSKKMILLK